MLTLWRQAPTDLRRRLTLIYALLIGFNLLVWAGALTAAAHYPLFLGLAAVAYGFGLRHAVDPDHIAAIDNTTRKLMQDGQRPVGVGLFFSLGHSTVVFGLSVLIVLSAALVQKDLPSMQSVGAVVGTAVSGIFLVAIAAVNALILRDIFRTWRARLRGTAVDQAKLEDYLDNRGLLARLLRPMLRLVRRSSHMYAIGLMFGLGFDTASEVGILGITAATALGPHGMPTYLILLLPLLFVAGMSLADTTDGVAMLGAYGWAYVRPMRKLYYNMIITFVSVIVALVVGGVEIAQVAIQETGARGSVWQAIGSIQLANLGSVIVLLLLLTWAGAVAYYRILRIDRLDESMPTPRAAGQR
ncbi:MAG: HoxN/HupN/NixA family nickel/cobalt transporter [Candidatus Eremiobacter antarcticus]|nr:HoxN/HupN/NixA family nickel/cobalt transporter [Candidatus Eremiobacteraeota bacterium]MBC5807651.1 HoxN/HupN/NixA family nickel/cobalt transporter [Candidatus Eremiobacteraeota bacterium]PZR60542.1 MAG: HoxN/HupN/NixA family nickel/cobalt transporter [Candidatus Eremiobacter sp. RRmetagenome_bin22]